MKKYLKFILLITVLNLSLFCSQNSKLANGIFKAKNKTLFYAIELNNSKKIIKFYVLENYSEVNTIAENLYKLQLVNKNSSKENYKFYFTGNFTENNGKLFVENLESDILPTNRPKKIEGKIIDGKIIFDCEILSNYFIGKNNLCTSKEIEYMKK